MIKLRDVFIIVVFIVAAALLYFAMDKGNGCIAVIEADGAEYVSVDFSILKEGEQRSFFINGVTIVIDKDGAKITESECKGKICVNTGRISKSGQVSVCLPQRVSVSIQGGETKFDGITG